MKRIIIIAALLCVCVLVNPITTRAEAKKDTWICAEYQVYIQEISAEYGICPELIMAIIEKESSGQADATNGSCIGLMQVSERWHKDRMERLGVTDLYDPYSNILVGTDYLVELFEKYEDLPMVLMTYNGSSDARCRYESGNYTSYAIAIMERSAELERLHEIAKNRRKTI